jgi:predicted ATPase
LTEKVRGENYGKYLRRIRLHRVRGFQDRTIRFDFPVTALIGPNGGGKTTILGAAGCAYTSVKPRLFFAKSGKFDEGMQDWSFEYELIDRDANPREPIRRTTSFRQLRWKRESVSRETVVFGVQRTVPANERRELQKCASNRFSVPDSSIHSVPEDVARAVATVLGKDITGYTTISVNPRTGTTMLAAASPQYSEFHFGAGESSVIRMISAIEARPENSLILIEEIENGLHPVATVRMVEYLIDVAYRKKAQVIFTTHSNDALELRSEAIWAAIEGDIYQGKLDIAALRAVTGRIDAQLAIFTEDIFSADWLRTALRSYGRVALEAVQVYGLQGDGTAVALNRHHNNDPSATFPSVCFIDGDSRMAESYDDRVYRLPGGVPESYVFGVVADDIDQWVGRLSVALQVPFTEQETVKRTVIEVSRTNRDPHILFSQVGEWLGFISEIIVRGAFLSIWAQARPDEVRSLLEPVAGLLPIVGARSAVAVGDA